MPRLFSASIALFFIFLSSAGLADDKVSETEKAVMEGNARLLSILLPEVKGLVEEETAPIRDKLNEILKLTESEENRRLAIKKSAKAAFDKAQDMADLGNMKEAGLYYSIACFSDPEEGLYLYGYVNAVLNWAERSIKSGRPEAALLALSDMERFLYANASLILPSNAESAEKLLKNIELKAAEAGKAAFSKNKNTGVENVQEIINEAKKALSFNIPEGLDNVTSYQVRLQTLAAKLMKFSSDDSDEDLFLTIKRLSSRINEAAGREDAERMLEKGFALIDAAEEKRINISDAAKETAVINQRLALLYFGVSPALKRRIDIFSKRFDGLSAEAARSYGRKAVLRLKNKYDAVVKRLVKNETNAEKALKSLYALQDEIIIESSAISDADTLKEIRGLISSINGDTETWRDIQYSRYERWAVKTVIKFNDLYKSEMGVLGSGRDTKNRIYLGMKDYLCPIDLKYLGVPGLRAYTEVFDFFYKELDRDQRLDLSTEFVNCAKKPLSEF